MDWYSSFNYMFPYTMNFSSGLGQYPMYSSGMNYMNYQQPMFSFGSAYSSQNSMMNSSDYWDSWVKSMLNNSNSNYSWQQPMNYSWQQPMNYSWQQPMNYDTYWSNQAKSSNDSNNIYWKDNTATEIAEDSEQKTETQLTETQLTEEEKKALDTLEKVAVKKEKAENGDLSCLAETGSCVALGAASQLGLSPIAKSKAYLLGEHNKLFSRDFNNDIYNTKSYAEVYKSNSKLMNDAKAAMRKAEMLNKKSYYNLSDDLYNSMSKKMEGALKELASNPNSVTAKDNLKNVTEAINKTTSQRKGWFKTWWSKIRGKQEQDLSKIFNDTLDNINKPSAPVAQKVNNTTQVVSKGSKFLKGTKKLLKKVPWLIFIAEAVVDIPKICTCYKKDSKTGHKQVGKTIFKAAGATAGMALGTKLGMMIGSIIPGAGTVVGGIVGAVAGLAIGGLCSWLGREGGKAIGGAIFGKEDEAAKINASDVKKLGTKESATKIQETIAWAYENQDKLTEEEKNVINPLIQTQLDATG
ncbi:hypothetical protein J6R97_08880 [bacterium]|nr:hypothetical protein [bacterium]